MAVELTQHLYYWIVPNSHNLLKLLISLYLEAFPLFVYGPNLPIWWIGDDTQI